MTFPFVRLRQYRQSWLIVLAGFIACASLSGSLEAKDSLGVFGQWGAFRDSALPRCYAIAAAAAEPRSARHPIERAASVSVGTWPRRQVRGQVSLRLSRTVATRSGIRLAIADQRFNLTGGGADAWASDAAMDAAIRAAMRSATGMSVTAVDRTGHRFTDRFSLSGAATAMDAATVGCAPVR